MNPNLQSQLTLSVCQRCKLPRGGVELISGRCVSVSTQPQESHRLNKAETRRPKLNKNQCYPQHLHEHCMMSQRLAPGPPESLPPPLNPTGLLYLRRQVVSCFLQFSVLHLLIASSVHNKICVSDQDAKEFTYFLQQMRSLVPSCSALSQSLCRDMRINLDSSLVFKVQSTRTCKR